MGDQFEVVAAVEVGVRFCEEEFGSGDDVRMRGCLGESDVGRLIIDRSGIVLFGVIAVAAGAAHRVAVAMSRAIHERPHAEVAVTVNVMEKSRTR